jgi:hypothetical protein
MRKYWSMGATGDHVQQYDMPWMEAKVGMVVSYYGGQVRTQELPGKCGSWMGELGMRWCNWRTRKNERGPAEPGNICPQGRKSLHRVGIEEDGQEAE